MSPPKSGGRSFSRQARQPRLQIRVEDERAATGLLHKEAAGLDFLVDKAAPEAGDFHHLADRVSQPLRVSPGANFFWSHESTADIFREARIGLRICSDLFGVMLRRPWRADRCPYGVLGTVFSSGVLTVFR